MEIWKHNCIEGKPNSSLIRFSMEFFIYRYVRTQCLSNSLCIYTEQKIWIATRRPQLHSLTTSRSFHCDYIYKTGVSKVTRNWERSNRRENKRSIVIILWKCSVIIFWFNGEHCRAFTTKIPKIYEKYQQWVFSRYWSCMTQNKPTKLPPCCKLYLLFYRNNTWRIYHTVQV